MIFRYAHLLFLILFCALLKVTPARAHQEPGRGYGFDTSLEFVENRNQWESAVKYSAALPSGRLFLKQNQWLFSFVDETQLPKHGNAGQSAAKSQLASPLVRAHSYTVTFLKANPQPDLKPAHATPGFRNYFLGNDPAKWASNVKAFEAISYQELYPGIEAKIYEHDQKLKYDFIVAPQANPDLIQMEYAGADKLFLENGNLVIKTSVNTVTEQKPVAYQLVNGQRKEVPCEFRLRENVLSFHFPKGYRRKLPLVIDPTLVFSSYSGATADNWGFTATYDNDGNMYSGGVVFFVDGGTYPVTPGAFQISRFGLTEIGIMKYNPNASGAASRVWATYLGGNGVEAPHSLVATSRNELVILGTTSSNNFPVLGSSYDPIFNGGNFIDPLGFGSNYLAYNLGSDIFVTKLNTAGTALMGSTFLGGSGNDGLLTLISPLVRNYGDQFRGDVFADAADNIYVTSSTSSLDFPIVNGFQTQYGGGQSDAVVCRFSPNLESLHYSSFLGGLNDDAAYSVQVDASLNIYVCGGTTSTDLPQTTGGFKANFTPGFDAVEGFASKIAATGTLTQSTYIGASPGYDQTYFLQLDAQRNVYLLGQSEALYPSTGLVFNSNPGRQFIQKLNTSLTASVFSLNFGSGALSGKYDISPTAFLVDNCERIFVCGWGGRDNQLNPKYVGGNTFGLPVTSNAHQSTTDGSDFYLMQLSQNGALLEYATYLGGNSSVSAEHVDGGTSRFDKRGFVYHAVCAGCGNTNAFPTTPNAWAIQNGNTQAGNSNNCNAAAFKFDFAVSSAVAGAKQTACFNGGKFAVTGASPAGGTWSGSGVNAGGLFDPLAAGLGTHVLTYTVTVGNCVSHATKTITVVPPPKISISAPDSVFCIYSSVVTLTPSLPGGTFSGPGLQPTNQFSPAAAGPGSHLIKYTYTDSLGCVSVAEKTMVVELPPTVVAGPPEGICAVSEAYQLTGATPAGGVWSGNGVSPTGLFTPSEALIGKQTLTYTVSYGDCVYAATKEITVDPAPEVFANLTLGNCGTLREASGYAPLQVTFENSTFLGKGFRWEFGDGTSSTEFNPQHTYSKPGTYTVTLTTDFGRGCSRTAVVNTVTVVEPLLPNVITPNNDTRNDNFMPRVSCLPLNLKIYSRWGKLVYETDNYQENFNGSNLSGGVYFYFLRDTNNRTWKGWLEIIK